jgi:TetR/AcrR family transcriptional repressor of adeIJK operon
MNQDLAHIEASGCDFPQTKRGHERRLALLISANQLFLEHGWWLIMAGKLCSTSPSFLF